MERLIERQQQTDRIISRLSDHMQRAFNQSRTNVVYPDEGSKYYRGIYEGLRYAVRVMREEWKQQQPQFRETQYLCSIDFGLCEDDRPNAWMMITGKDGPLSPEVKFDSLEQAKAEARMCGYTLGVPAYECDEFGAKACAYDPDKGNL